jgi:hypothetical protein
MACSSRALSSSTTPKARLLNSLLAAMAMLAASIGRALSLSLSLNLMCLALSLSLFYFSLSLYLNIAALLLCCPISPLVPLSLKYCVFRNELDIIYLLCIGNFTNYFDFFSLSIGLSSILMALQERVCPVTVSSALSPCALAAALNHNKGKCLHVFVRIVCVHVHACVRACVCACYVCTPGFVKFESSCHEVALSRAVTCTFSLSQPFLWREYRCDCVMCVRVSRRARETSVSENILHLS